MKLSGPAWRRLESLDMTFYVLINHLLNFMAPAAVVALLLVVFSRLLFGIFTSKMPLVQSWRAQAAINFIVGLGVLLAGLVLLGRDGKMLTYTALIWMTATCQWWLMGGARR